MNYNRNIVDILNESFEKKAPLASVKIEKFKDLDFNEINLELINNLLIRGVFNENGDCEKKNNSKKITSNLIFNNKSYKINPSIIEDIYQNLKSRIETEMTAYLIINNIKLEVERRLSKKLKLDYLHNQYKKIFKPLKNWCIYPGFEEYKMNIEDNDTIFKKGLLLSIEFWDELIECYVTKNSSFGDFFMNFEMNNEDNLENDFIRWRSYFVIYETSYFIKNEINKINLIDNPKETFNQFNFDCIHKTILFEKILMSNNWMLFSPNKKAEILSALFGNHKDTIRNSLDIINPAKQKTKKNLQRDNDLVDSYLRKLGVTLGDPSV